MNFNFKDITSEDIKTFGDLKKALQSNFDELLSKGYLYKGDMGETPQIVNRSLIERFDDKGNVIEWSALGKSIIGEIFKDIEKYKGYYKDGNVVDIDDLIGKLTEDGKLNGLAEAASAEKSASSSTYPWWCADGNPDYPIYPATYFVYIDSTPNNIRNNDKDWEDNSCVLIPADVEYNDYRDGAPEEEREPTVTYHKNHIYPSFYFDSDAASAGAWCWKINDVETGIPASVANDDGSVLGHMFIFKNEDGVYKYKAGVDAEDKWMTRQEMMNSELRYPINGDIGFTIEKVKETGDNPTTTETTGGASATIASINTLQIYNFVEDDKDSVNVNGGAWGLGGNLISFGESFYKALWKFISSDSGVEINKGKIILGTTSGNHCIFVKKDDSQTGQTLVLMPYQGDPSEKTDFADDDIWKEAKLQLNYPETTINGSAIINSQLTVNNNIEANSISLSGDITECKNIISKGNITVDKSISCGGITTNTFITKDKSVTIGSNDIGTKVNILSDNFNVKDNYIGTNLPINISKTSDTYIKISNTPVLTERTQLNQADVKTESTTSTIIKGGDDISSSVKGSYDGIISGSGVIRRTVEVTYKSEDYTLPEKMAGITLSMPNSLGISINVYGKNSYNSWPFLKNGSMTLKLFAKNITTGEDEELCTSQRVTIAKNTSAGFNTSESTKYCVIYCSFTPEQLNTASLKLYNGKNIYKSIYITAEATFKLETNDGTWGQQETIYGAGTVCKICSRISDSSGASEWLSSNPADSAIGRYIIFKADAEIQKGSSSDDIKTVHICPDGILIGRASNKSAILYIDNDSRFHIEYYKPETPTKDNNYAVSKKINILSIDTSGKCESDVFQLKPSTTTSTES